MGQKIHPKLFRLGQTATWQSRWFDLKQYTKFLKDDHMIRRLIMDKFKKAAIAEVDIERFGTEINVTVHTARPGVIIGRGGAGIETLKKKISQSASGTININILEVRNPETNAAVVASNIAEQIERRIPFRRIIKQALEAAKQAKAEGVRISVAGRLNGAEIARRETLTFGKVPLHTIKQKIDYARRTAYTTYGTIGIKVWIVKPESKPENK